MQACKIPARIMPELETVTGIAGTITAVIAVAGILIAIMMSPWFEWTTNALSHLGEQGKPSELVYNLSLIIAGILTLLFTGGLFKKMGYLAGSIGVLVLAVAAVTLVAIGVFNLPHYLHLFPSVAFFTLLPASLLLIWIGLSKDGKHRLASFTLIAGAVTAACAIATIALFFESGLGVAIPAFIFVLVTAIWIFIFGVKLATKNFA